MTFDDEQKDGLHTHTLRHSGASLMYNENDTDILVLKKVLGHKSIAATEIYTHVDTKKMKVYNGKLHYFKYFRKKRGGNR